MKNASDQFPILQKYTYLNTARFCALPQPVIAIQHEFLTHLCQDGSWNFANWSVLYETTRAQAADLIGCATDSTFFLPNVSIGFNLAAQYLPKRKVICLDGDFPSVSMAWQSHGFEVNYLDYKTSHFGETLLHALKEPRQIVSLSWIQSADGYEIDLELIFNLCKKYDHYLILDGTQGLGAIPFMIDPDVDCIFLASGFKWLLAGYGIAVAYASDRLLPLLKPFVGWNSGIQSNGKVEKSAQSLEVGNAAYLNVAALNEGIKIINQTSIQAICEHNLVLKHLLLTQLAKLNIEFSEYNSRSSIVRFRANEWMFQKLKAANIQVTDQSNSIRVSPHFYNNALDIEKLLSVIS